MNHAQSRMTAPFSSRFWRRCLLLVSLMFAAPAWTAEILLIAAEDGPGVQGNREACLAAGMNDYLSKLFKRTDLQQILQRWVH